MKATKARDLVHDFIKQREKGYEPILEKVYKNIEKAAKSGKNDIAIEWGDGTNIQQRNKICEILDKEGYHIYCDTEEGCRVERVNWAGGD